MVSFGIGRRELRHLEMLSGEPPEVPQVKRQFSAAKPSYSYFESSIYYLIAARLARAFTR